MLLAVVFVAVLIALAMMVVIIWGVCNGLTRAYRFLWQLLWNGERVKMSLPQPRATTIDK